MGQIDAMMDKGLSHLVERRVVEVFGLESGFIDEGVPWIALFDHMLLGE
jgi:hypothetical protein